MRPALFVVAVAAAAAFLVPSDALIFEAARRSRPRPELEAYFRKRASGGPGSADALRELARLRRSLGDREGEKLLRETLRNSDPEDAANLEALMRLYAWENRPDDAYVLARSLVGRFPDRRDLRELALELAEYSGRAAEARPHAVWLLERGLRTERMARVFVAARDARGIRSVLASPREQAEALVAMGAQKEAIAAYREHLILDPLDTYAKRWLARLYRWNHRPMDAARELEESLAIEDDPEVRKELLAIYRSVNRIDLMLPHLPAGLERAEILVAVGRVEEARDLYWRFRRFDRLLELARGMPLEDEELRVRERMPMDAENRERLADLYAWRKDFARALALYESVNSERAVDMHLALGDAEGALRTAGRLGLHRRLGDLHLWSGDVERAIREYAQVPGEELEVARLLLSLGRKDEAARILDALPDGTDPYPMAELYFYAGRGARGLEILRSLPAAALDFERAEEITRAAAGPDGARFYEWLLTLRPRHEACLRALADLYEALGRKEDLVRTLRTLVDVSPRDAELHARLGLILSDRLLLERAVGLGSREPLVVRRLAEIARGERRTADAVAYFRAYHRLRDDDAETHFALAELTGDAAEIQRAWDLLPPGEKRIRARILIWRGDLARAEALLREAGDGEGLAELLLSMRRLEEAAQLPLTLRQRAVLAIYRGRHAEAARLLRQLDLTDPDVRSALGDALFALGRWREAEEYASPELRLHIRGTHGPEASTDLRLHEAPDERHVSLEARYRAYLTQELFFRIGGVRHALKGEVGTAAAERSADLERADASFHYRLLPGLRVGGGAAGWRNEFEETASGTAEALWETAPVAVELQGEFGGPWIGSLEAALLGGRRDRVSLQATASPFAGLHLLAGAERLRYEAGEGEEFGLEGETAEELRLRARAELRLWTGPGSVGRYFFDLPLRRDAAFDTHLAVFAQFDSSELEGSEALVSFVQLVPESRMLSAGPAAAWAGEGWGITASLFAGQDDARGFGFGKLWGGSLGAVATVGDRWKFSALGEYVNEQRQAVAGEAWTVTFGLHFNF